jgi:hypothetical protein
MYDSNGGYIGNSLIPDGYPTGIACTADSKRVWVTTDKWEYFWMFDKDGKFSKLSAGDSGFGSSPTGVACSLDPVVVYIITANGLLKVYTEGEVKVPCRYDFLKNNNTRPRAIACDATGQHVWVIGDNDRLYVSNDSANTFKDVDSNFNGEKAVGVSLSVDGTKGYVVTEINVYSYDGNGTYTGRQYKMPTGAARGIACDSTGKKVWVATNCYWWWTSITKNSIYEGSYQSSKSN